MATILAKRVHGCCRAGLIGIALLALGSATTAQSAGTMMIKVENYSFMPSELTVAPGTTVTWINKDDSPHTISSTDHVLASKAMDTDDQFSFTFDKEGDYKYFCTLHPYMVGVVKVRSQ
jgi:plastocyanin